eukprot:gene14218-15701_t
MNSDGKSEAVSDANSANNEDGESPSFMWRMLLGSIRQAFPGAKQLHTEKLAAWINDPHTRKSILLLDVREKDENVVSTIEGAVQVDVDGSDHDVILQNIFEKSDHGSKSNGIKKVICFCSVGYRSSKLAQILSKKLKKEGNDDSYEVFNLEGSIFKWANEKRDMVDMHGNKTIYCHPYSLVWGKFLDSQLRKYTL